MNYRIVVSSSADLKSNAQLVSVPLKIITPNKEYTDDESLDLVAMVEDLETCNAKTGTSCPNVHDWLAAFGDCENIFIITITSKLSGAYNTARLAKEEYSVTHPQANICLFDSLNAGPGERILVRKIEDYIAQGLSFETIVPLIEDYNRHKRILFSLESFNNLANNGRVSKVLAKAANFLGIRGIAIDQDGEISGLAKVKGEKRALKTIREYMGKFGYQGGRVLIDHCFNQKAAELMAMMIKESYPTAEIEMGTTTGLCSYYAERGAILVAFETIPASGSLEK